MKKSGGSATSRRAEILRSAVAAFRRHGYHGASVDEIARALGMTKGNLYYYFKNKEEILFFCHDWSLDILLDRLSEVESEGGPPDRKLRRLIVAFVHMIIDELHGTALTLDLQALSPAHLQRVIGKRDRFDRGLRRIIEDGIASGEFAPGDSKLLTFAVLGAANWITRWYDPKGPASSDEIGNAFADFCLRGMREHPAREARRARGRPALTATAGRGHNPRLNDRSNRG